MRIIWICLVVLTATAGALHAQPRATLLATPTAEKLVTHGFEDVSVSVVEGGMIVGYENRVYRYEIRAIQEIIQLLGPDMAPGQMLTLVPHNRGVALASITVPADAYHAFRRGETDAAQFVDAIGVSFRPTRLDVGQVVSHANPSTFKLDVTLQPQLRTEFGKFSDPIESQINLVPGVSTSLWKGMRLSAQVILPLQNELDPAESQVRPGVVTLTQTLRPLPSTIVSASAGYFTNNQYGVDLSAQHYLMGGRLMLGAGAGYTGYAALDDGTWYYGGVDVLTYAAGVRYHLLPQRSFWVQAGYGQYLYQDRGWRVDMERAFGEVRIGFYGIVTDGGENAGARISVPLVLRKYGTRGRIRFRPAERFSWQYDYRKLELSGTAYDTHDSIDAFWKGLTPVFVKAQLAALDGWR